MVPLMRSLVTPANTESAMPMSFLPSSVICASIFSLVPDQAKNRVKKKAGPHLLPRRSHCREVLAALPRLPRNKATSLRVSVFPRVLPTPAIPLCTGGFTQTPLPRTSFATKTAPQRAHVSPANHVSLVLKTCAHFRTLRLVLKTRPDQL